MIYLLSTTIDNQIHYFCGDRKWRIYYTVGTFKECVKTFKKTNNATTLGNRLLKRKFIDNFKVVEVE
jgi:hypothetical protein